MAAELIPGLIQDVALHCMAQASHTSHASMMQVCKLWESTISSNDFYKIRKRAGTTRPTVCFVQSIATSPVISDSVSTPVSNSPSPANKSSAPTHFGLSVFDLGSRTFERLPPIPELPTGLPLFCQCAAVGSRVYVLGGWNPTTYQATRSVFCFDFSSRSWRRCADMRTTRSFFACAAAKGKIFVAGGHDNGKFALASAEVFDPESNSWAALPPMSEPRDECRAVFLPDQDLLLVVSGYGSDSQGDFVPSAEAIHLGHAKTESVKWQRIEEFWRRGDTPNAVAVSGAEVVSVDESGNVSARRDAGGDWRRLTAPPSNARIAAAVTTGADAVFVAAQDGMFFLLRPGGSVKSQWEVLTDVGDEFRGVVQGQGACLVEI